MERIIGSQGDEDVFKMNILLQVFKVFGHRQKKECPLWENSNFDFVASDSLGNSGAIYGTWLPRNVKILLVAVYAPQQPGSKRALWDFLSNLVRRWNGEAIIMGDFNDVRTMDERLGSSFNVSSARCFDRFIVSLSGGCQSLFKLCILTVTCPIHRPILLREVLSDFGPTLFRFYQSWLRMEGFDSMVEHAWLSFSHSDSNAMTERGNVSDDILLNRMDLNRRLQDIKLLEVKDLVQKSKIKWAIEGDENSKFFHGITLKFCFSNRVMDFCLKLNAPFHNRLSSDQVDELDRAVSRDEIRRAVWNCGENKSPGPDGYTFEFFRKYWSLVDFARRMIRFGGLSLGYSYAFGCGRIGVGDPCRYLSSFPVLLMIGLFKVSIAWLGEYFSLFYADDAMFIGEFWSEQNLHNIVKVLNCFHLASGLKINIAKSQVLGVGVSQNVVVQAANRIGCAVLNTPFRYLGVTVGECMYLGVGLGWLVKQTPRPGLSLMKVPKGVLKTMESIRSKFFNGVDSSDRKISWVAWDNVLASKLNGGLGVSSFFALNRALLLKWVWRFISGDGSFMVYKVFGMILWLDDAPSLCSVSPFVALELDKEIVVANKMGASSVSASFADVRDGAERATRVVGSRSGMTFLKLPTRVNLSRRGVLLDSHLCPLCNAAMEDEFVLSRIGMLVLIPFVFIPVSSLFRRYDECVLEESHTTNKKKIILMASHDQQWYMDTEATSHLSYHTGNLQTSFRNRNFHSVIVGNGSSIHVTHSGHVQIPNPYRPLHLRNVLVTPNIIKNLVSIRKFTTDNKCSIDFDPYGSTVRDYHTRQTLLRCDSTGDLYPLHVAASAFALLTNNHSLWHQRLGHPVDAVIQTISSRDLVSYNKNTQHLCCACQLGKQTKLLFQRSTSIVTSPFDIIHSDLWTSPVSSMSGYKYYVLFLDHYSHFLWVYPLHRKSDAQSKLLHFCAFIKTQFNREIKAFQCDHGGEFENNSLHELFATNGIQFCFSCPRTSQQNGKSKRMIRTINNVVRSLLFQARLPPEYWVKALLTAAYLLNILPSTSINSKRFQIQLTYLLFVDEYHSHSFFYYSLMLVSSFAICEEFAMKRNIATGFCAGTSLLNWKLTGTKLSRKKLVLTVMSLMHDPRGPSLNARSVLMLSSRGKTNDLRLKSISINTSQLIGLLFLMLTGYGCPCDLQTPGQLYRFSAEAEYRRVTNVVAETSWIRNLLRELHTPLFKATLIYCDNVSAVYVSANHDALQPYQTLEISKSFYL
ncbi:ribonuclease H-like domain-containing protein [Tanacetum coccineum]